MTICPECDELVEVLTNCFFCGATVCEECSTKHIDRHYSGEEVVQS